MTALRNGRSCDPGCPGRSQRPHMNLVRFWVILLSLGIAAQPFYQQRRFPMLAQGIPGQSVDRSPGPAPQQSSPMVDSTRPHPRVLQHQIPGKRIALWIGTLYLSPQFRPRARVPLVVHFHGVPWLVEYHIMQNWPDAALISVHLGAGSSIYSQTFSDGGTFTQLLRDALGHLRLATRREVEWSTITLTSFSAGYGAIRSILQHADDYAKVDAVLLADSLHTSYSPDGTPPKLNTVPLDVFVRFAQDAAQNRKRMWITHSEVYPGTYASTTETADFLLESLQAKRQPILLQGPVGMQQLSRVEVRDFHLAGFAGNSAPDHLDHFYALGKWLATLRRLIR